MAKCDHHKLLRVLWVRTLNKGNYHERRIICWTCNKEISQVHYMRRGKVAYKEEYIEKVSKTTNERVKVS